MPLATARLAPLLLATCLGLAACGDPAPRAAGPATSGPPVPLQAAPEPARAPTPGTAPAGTVLDLGGGRPEGMVADPVTGLVLVALRDPDRLAVVDPGAPRVLRDLPVPGAARHLELVPGGGAVVVPGEDTDLVSTVALPGGEVLHSVRVGRQPHDAAVLDDGDLYVADEFGGTVSVVRGDAVVATLPSGLQPGGAEGVGDTAAVVDVRGRQVHFFRGGVEIAALPAGEGPTHALRVGRSTVYVADTSGGALIRYDVSGTPRQAGSVPLPGRPYGMALDEARQLVYVTATERNELVQLRVTPDGLEQVRTWPTVQDAYDVAVVPSTGRVVVAGELASQLQLLDP